jgi:hypothetical protein
MRHYRELSVSADTHIRLALMQGTLRRAAGGDDCDFLVGGSSGNLHRVRLLPEHVLGPPDGPVVIDAFGVPFAYDGDEVQCVGGGHEGLFVAAKLRVFE